MASDNLSKAAFSRIDRDAFMDASVDVFSTRASRITLHQRVEVKLYGLTFSESKDTLQYFIPHKVDVQNRHTLPNIKRVDTIRTWKGLSVAQARELQFWERAFEVTLENAVASALIADFESSDARICKDDIDDELHSLAEYIALHPYRQFEIDIVSLISGIERIYEKHGKHLRWFQQASSIPTAVCNYLRTRTVLVDNYPSTLFHATFSTSRTCDRLSGILISGHAMHIGHALCLADFVGEAVPGSDFRLKPEYSFPILNPIYPTFSGNPVYQVGSSVIPVEYDQTYEGFRCLVPSQPFLMQSSVAMDLCVTASWNFPGAVRFEEISRYKVTLLIRSHGPPYHVTRPYSSGARPAGSDLYPGFQGLSKSDHEDAELQIKQQRNKRSTYGPQRPTQDSWITQNPDGPMFHAYSDSPPQEAMVPSMPKSDFPRPHGEGNSWKCDITEHVGIDAVDEISCGSSARRNGIPSLPQPKFRLPFKEYHPVYNTKACDRGMDRPMGGSGYFAWHPTSNKTSPWLAVSNTSDRSDIAQSISEASVCSSPTATRVPRRRIHQCPLPSPPAAGQISTSIGSCAETVIANHDADDEIGEEQNIDDISLPGIDGPKSWAPYVDLRKARSGGGGSSSNSMKPWTLRDEVQYLQTQKAFLGNEHESTEFNNYNPEGVTSPGERGGTFDPKEDVEGQMLAFQAKDGDWSWPRSIDGASHLSGSHGSGSSCDGVVAHRQALKTPSQEEIQVNYEEALWIRFGVDGQPLRKSSEEERERREFEKLFQEQGNENADEEGMEGALENPADERLSICSQHGSLSEISDGEEEEEERERECANEPQEPEE